MERIGGLMKSTNRFAVAAAAGLFLGGLALSPAKAADLGGDCCADLEERVAELEATTARKGNRVVSLTVYGHVNKALLIWDTGGAYTGGDQKDVYVVDNSNSGSRFGFKGSANIGRGWSAGYHIEVGITDANSSNVDQINGNGNGDDRNGESLYLRLNYLWIKGHIGKVSLGHNWTATGTVEYIDLSGSGVVAGPDGNSWNAFFFQACAGGGNRWSTSIGALSTGRLDIIRYDSPTFAGFTISTSWGEDDFWDVALRYANEFSSIRVAGGIGYADYSEMGWTQWAGSIALIHTPSGVNIMFAGGERDDGNAATPNRRYWYLKGGVYAKHFAMGKTSIYGEYGRYYNVNFASETADMWGLGVVQYIDAAAMELYLGFRHYSTDWANNTVNDMYTFAAGGRIKF